METTQQEKAAEAFRLALNRRIAEGKRGTVTRLAELLDTTRGTISRWASGSLKNEKVPYPVMAKRLSALGIDPSMYFWDDAADEGQYTNVPWLDATLSMGGGGLETAKSVNTHLAFRTDWLRSKGLIKGMVVVNASGDSMEPTIPDKSIVLINELDTRPVNNGIFFVCYEQFIFLKRLRVDKGGHVTHLISDNGGYEMPLAPVSYFEIVGRALWFGKEL